MANGEFNHTFLMHHGIKGMKWGKRRYQNEDGTLTEAGKKRYSKLNEKVEKQTTNVNKNKKQINDEKETLNNAVNTRLSLMGKRASLYNDNVTQLSKIDRAKRLHEHTNGLISAAYVGITARKLRDVNRKIAEYDREIELRGNDITILRGQIAAGENKLHRLQKRLDKKITKRDKYGKPSIEHSSVEDENVDSMSLKDILESLTGEELRKFTGLLNKDQYKIFCCLVNEAFDD